MPLPLQLPWLDFESTDNGDDTHTLEAMASVRPARASEVLAEVAEVLTWLLLHRPNGPRPLEDGGDWDLLLQAQIDEQPAVTLGFDDKGGQLLGMPTLPVQGWVCVTCTLVMHADVAQALSGKPAQAG